MGSHLAHLSKKGLRQAIAWDMWVELCELEGGKVGTTPKTIPRHHTSKLTLDLSVEVLSVHR